MDPSIASGKKLSEKWDDLQRPKRKIVCYTWVAASVHNGHKISIDNMEDVQPVFISADRDSISVYLDKRIEPRRRREHAFKVKVWLRVVSSDLDMALIGLSSCMVALWLMTRPRPA